MRRLVPRLTSIVSRGQKAAYQTNVLAATDQPNVLGTAHFTPHRAVFLLVLRHTPFCCGVSTFVMIHVDLYGIQGQSLIRRALPTRLTSGCERLL